MSNEEADDAALAVPLSSHDLRPVRERKSLHDEFRRDLDRDDPGFVIRLHRVLLFTGLSPTRAAVTPGRIAESVPAAFACQFRQAAAQVMM